MRLPIIIIVALVVMSLLTSCGSGEDLVRSDAGLSISTAFEQRKSDVQVEGEGVVTRILSDDREGSRHQRFIVSLASGQTVLIQHNIDLAPRVADLKVGDSVAFFGEYVWNEQGGLVHWTHHDPARRHVGGWVKHNGRTYE
jgi:hypothetical protein